MSPSFFKPKQTINRSTNDNKIGELLVKAQIISQKQLDECVRLAGSKRLHLGQMLIMSGYITPRDLQSAVDAQSSLRDKKIEETFAIKCLNISCKSERSFSAVVDEQSAIQEEFDANQDYTLGHLLFEAEAVSKDQLDAAVQRSYATGITMGRILVLNNACDEYLLAKALDLLVKIRDGLAERDDAVEALRTVIGAASETPATKSLLLPPTGKKIRLGELLLRAGVMGEGDVLNAVELGLTYKVPIGQIMVEQGYVAPHVVESALELQNYVEAEQINGDQAVETLRRIVSEGGSVQTMLGSINTSSSSSQTSSGAISFEKLLTLSRVIGQDQIDEAFNICRQTPEALAKILRLTGFIDENVHDAVLRCHQLMDAGSLNRDDALVALDYCLNKNTNGLKSFDQVLSELGWTGESGISSASSQYDTMPVDPGFDSNQDIQHEPVLQDLQEEPAQEGGGFDLLAHFGLSGESDESPEPQVDEADWAGDQVDDPSLGVSTSDVPASSLTDRLMEQAEAAPIVTPSPSDSNSRLAGILDKLADDPEEESQPPNQMLPEEEPEDFVETAPSNGQGAESPGLNLAAMLDRESGRDDIADSAPPPPPPSRSMPIDRDKLAELEKTVAPGGLNLDQMALTLPQEDGAEDISEKHEAVGAAMYRLAESYFEQADYQEAQKVYEKILAIKQKQFGAQDPGLVDDLNKLAEVLWVQGNYRAAEPFVRRAVSILESAQPMDMLKLSESVRTLAGLYYKQGKYEPCLPLLEHALMMKRMELGEEHKDVGSILREYAKLLKKLGRKDEAEQHYQQSKVILARYKK
ncbi:tetratricopeptide repeat protein [bacterium]|nr:tetratricopeptide repeat protein [bacterium]